MKGLSGVSSGITLEDESCAVLLRQLDPERFLCAFFAPIEYRSAVFAVLAFAAEIGRISMVVNEPLLGEIRLNWWREAVDRIYTNKKVENHTVIKALAIAIARFDLPQGYFEAAFSARCRDFDSSSAPANIAELESYARSVSGGIHELMLHICFEFPSPLSLEKARKIGTAWALIGLVRASMAMARIGRVLIPEEILNLHRIRRQDFLTRDFINSTIKPEMIAALRDLADYGASLLPEKMQNEHKAAAAYLPVILLRRHLDIIHKPGWFPEMVRPRTHFSPVAPLILWWAALKGYY